MPRARGPAPTQTEIVERAIQGGQFNGYPSVQMNDWMEGVDSALDSAFTVKGSTAVATSTAAIGTTPVTTTQLASGLYRVSYYLVELVPDNVGSSVTVTIGWTDHGTSRSLSGPALTANAITAAQSGTLLLRIDRSTPITYAVAYSSTGGAPPLQYALDVVLEQVSAT